MVTKVQYENGITTVQITTNTLKRLRILKAGLDFSSFDETINRGLDLIESDNVSQTKIPVFKNKKFGGKKQ